jgi:hypothetical protein
MGGNQKQQITHTINRRHKVLDWNRLQGQPYWFLNKYIKLNKLEKQTNKQFSLVF